MIPYRGKMAQILLAFGLHKETVSAMLYKNTKVIVCSPDGDTNFFDIIAGVLQGDTLAPCMFIIGQDYVLQMSLDLIKENGFTLKKVKSRQYPTETMTDADYIVVLANTPAQAESLLHSLEQTA